MSASSLRAPLGLELLVAGADGLLVQPSPALRPRTYSVISSRSSMNLESAAIRPISSSRLIVCLPGFLRREVGDELHDVVVVDRGRGKEDELEIELVEVGACFVVAGLALLLREPLGGFKVLRRGRRSARPWAGCVSIVFPARG